MPPQCEGCVRVKARGNVTFSCMLVKYDKHAALINRVLIVFYTRGNMYTLLNVC